MTQKRQLILGAEFHQSGDHEGGWRMPTAQPWRGTDLSYYQALSRVAEQGKMDFVFFADFIAYTPRIRQSIRWELEPLTLLAGIAASTSRIGLVATASTLYNEPVNLARSFATLDHLSAGRAAWNIVTTGEPATAGNFGHEAVLPHAQRYAQAYDYVEQIRRFWNDGDKPEPASGGHTGKALNIPASPQGRPVLVQAGASEDGRNFAARHAELVFTAQPTLEYAQAFYSDLRERAIKAGRSPDSLKIAPGFLTVIGSTVEEAQRLRNQLDDLLVPEIYSTLLAGFGIDLSKLDLDDELPENLGDISKFEGIKSRIGVIEYLLKHWGEKLTVRQLVRRLAGSRGHVSVVGTPEQVATTMREWFESRGADGFIVKSSHLPGGIQDFVDQVIPLLQRAGVFREEYAGRTLREHLGLEPLGNSTPLAQSPELATA